LEKSAIGSLHQIAARCLIRSCPAKSSLRKLDWVRRASQSALVFGKDAAFGVASYAPPQILPFRLPLHPEYSASSPLRMVDRYEILER